MKKYTTKDQTNLTEKDFEKLAQAYIDPELAIDAGVRRVDSQEGAEIVGRKATARNNYSGLVFPYFWPGESRARESRLRVDHPKLVKQSDGRTKEEGKYLSPPGRANLLYFLPGANPEHLNDVSIPAIFTEGEKKTIALSRYFHEREEARLIIGLSGVWNWKGTVGKETDGDGKRRDVKGVIPDFDRVEWDGREVWIIFDANVATNTSVEAARREFKKEMTRRGAFIRTIDLPPEDGINGVDDLLGRKGAEYVSVLFQNLLTAIPRKTSTHTVENCVFKVDEKGTWAIEMGSSSRVKIGAPLHIEADTRNARGESWGRLLVFQDREGREKSWIMPLSLLAGDRSRYRERLLDMGLTIAPGNQAEKLLHLYLYDSPTKIALSVDRVGWAEGSFVFPNETVGGRDGERIYLQASSGINNLLGTAGTLAQWQEAISHFCISNSRLMFAVSAGFAAPLLSPFGIAGGGFHFMGKSSVGKSTSLYVGGSVWGGGGKEGYVQTWKSTGTGLEYLSEYHNDNLLCLDEIGEANPKEIGQSVYMIANGRGKHRGERSGGLRKLVTWTVLALSSGEKTLEEYMSDGDQKIKEGQEVRLLHLPADAGAGYGVFEDLHGFDNGKEFSDHLRSASQCYYGTPIRVFLDRLINQRLTVTIRQRFEAYKKQFIADNLTKKDDKIAARAAERFAIVGFAGVLASEWGITGWPINEATAAASKLFKDCFVFRGQRDGGEDAGVLRVMDFIQRHGASRFQSYYPHKEADDQDIEEIEADGETNNGEKVVNRAGFKTFDDARKKVVEYAIFPEVFKKEVCAGFDYQDVARRLKERKILIPGEGDNLQKKCTRGEFKKTRFYIIKNSPTAFWCSEPSEPRNHPT